MSGEGSPWKYFGIFDLMVLLEAEEVEWKEVGQMRSVPNIWPKLSPSVNNTMRLSDFKPTLARRLRSAGV